MADSVQIKKVNNWHQALSDFMIANPEAKAYEAAAFFGVSESWLSIVKNSDSFKDFHQKRRDQHFDRISTGVGEKLETLAELTLDEAIERVEESKAEGSQALPMSALTDLSKMALNAMGFGGRGGVQVNLNQDNRSVVVNDAAALKRARETMAEIRGENDRQIIEGRVSDLQETAVANPA